MGSVALVYAERANRQDCLKSHEVLRPTSRTALGPQLQSTAHIWGQQPAPQVCEELGLAQAQLG